MSCSFSIWYLEVLYIYFHLNLSLTFYFLGQRTSDADALWGNILPAADDTKKCGSMWHTGRLRNTNCNTKGFFICEHELDGPTESMFSVDIEENQQ